MAHFGWIYPLLCPKNAKNFPRKCPGSPARAARAHPVEGETAKVVSVPPTHLYCMRKPDSKRCALDITDLRGHIAPSARPCSLFFRLVHPRALLRDPTSTPPLISSASTDLRVVDTRCCVNAPHSVRAHFERIRQGIVSDAVILLVAHMEYSQSLSFYWLSAWNILRARARRR